MSEQVPPGVPPMNNPKAAAAAAKAYAKAERPWYKKKRFMIPLVIIVIAVLSSAMSGGGGDDGPKLVDDSTNSETSTQSDSTKASSEDKSDKVGSRDNPVKVGQTIELKGTRYTVKSARTMPEVGNEFMKEKASGVYVVVELTIENKKDESKTFFDEAAKFVTADGKSYGTDSDATIAGLGDGEEALILTEMHPDLPVTGRLIFDVPPAKAKGGMLEVGDLFGGGEAYVALGLK